MATDQPDPQQVANNELPPQVKKAIEEAHLEKEKFDGVVKVHEKKSYPH